VDNKPRIKKTILNDQKCRKKENEQKIVENKGQSGEKTKTPAKNKWN
jgi:hypothetical protein